MKFIIIFGVAIIVKAAVSDLLSPPEPFSMESFGPLRNGYNTGTKNGNKKGNRTSGDKNQVINVKPTKPIVTGGDGRPIVQRAEPTIRSIKSNQGETGTDGKDKSSSGDGNSDSSLVEVPLSILESVKQDEKSLRGGNAEIKPENSESREDSRGDKSGLEKIKKDPILESIEGAEKQLSEAFSAVRTKIMSMGRGQKPIKVDCGTTRVRVVCSKKGEPEITETPETTEGTEKTKTPKAIIEAISEVNKEAEEENPEERTEESPESEMGKGSGESEDTTEGEEE
ncbi:hypothetical protein MACK_002220 [Theileria orientalis]|uniref:Uncharacterized protein n=1 Tax=Theileria orientalis TaxID=68886 RepID=A0A976MBU8_THEOR|nr:hypothetical protein MACK_002220 [Theileria orientalis]